ncbi:hypothetical protein [Mesorhizobium sp. M1027]|uniref:hypothetical protein n=1 Tax=Mesorhizobium sp. M1027 TaxID=2957050 RepID=UPI0033384961
MLLIAAFILALCLRPQEGENIDTSWIFAETTALCFWGATPSERRCDVDAALLLATQHDGVIVKRR